MVARTSTDPRLDIGLDLLARALADLPEVAGEWAALSDGERASWSLDWDHLMASYLRLLGQTHQDSGLSEEQEAAYDALRCRLREALPLIEQLNLYRPPVALDG